MRFIQHLLLLTLTVGVFSLKAEPLSPTQWYHITTPEARLIFRGNMNETAQRLANTLAHIHGPVSQSLGNAIPSIPITLWDQNFTMNGSFSLPPQRLELYSGAPQDYNFLGTNEWFNLLAVHELRHAAQYAKLNRNFYKALHWLGGEMALSSIIGLLIPAWFFEGDAVGTETALTKSGRGRIPHFSLLYKTNLLERGGFSYSKQLFRSFNHEVPNHYRVGYYLTTHLRRKYGPGVIGNILEKATYPMLFPIAVRKATGKSLRQLYKDTNEELKGLWQKQLEGLQLTPTTNIMTRRDEIYTDYDCPQVDEEGNIIVLKKGLGTPAQFVRLDPQGKERTLFIPGNITSAGFSLAQGQLVWTEDVPHPRWELQHYGAIQHYDLRTKQLKRLTHRSRYSTASLSPDATKIIAVETDTHYKHRLVVLDAADGKVLHRLPNPKNNFYLTPKWLAKGPLVVAVKHQQQKSTLTLVDTLTGESQDLLPYSEAHIGLPASHGQYIFYNSSHNGIDNIYALDLKSSQRYQVTSRKYGAYSPTVSADGRWIIFNDFTKDGMDVVKMPLDPQQWTPLAKVEDRSIRYYAPLVTQENKADILDHIPSQTYPVAPYYPAKKLLKPHSWAWPWISPIKTPKEFINEMGVIVKTEDLLHTTVLEGSYHHNVMQKIGAFSGKITYNAWYPVIELEGILAKNYHKNFTAKIGNLTFKLPLTFCQGQYTNKIKLSTTSCLKHFDKKLNFSQTYVGMVSREAKKSPRDLSPPWSQQLRLVYKHTPFNNEKPLTIMTATATFRFPGLFPHHSLSLSPFYRHTQIKKTDIKSLITPEFPEDPCQESNTNKVFIEVPSTKNIYRVIATYKWPIAYPDWSLGDLLYVKRLIGHLSYRPSFANTTEHWGTETIKHPYSYQYQARLGVSMDMGFSFLPALRLKVGGGVVYDQKSFLPFSILHFYVSP